MQQSWSRPRARLPVAPDQTHRLGIAEETRVNLEQLARTVANVFEDHVDEAKQDLRAQFRRGLAELDSRLSATVEALEGGQVVTLADCYKGTRSSDSTHHRRGDLVTDRGSCWLAIKDTTARPGETGDWHLIVKAGRNGRDDRRSDSR